MNSYQLAKLASSFVLPLAEAVEDPDTEAVLLADLGFALPPGITLVGGVRAALEAIADIAIDIADFDPDAGDSSLELVARMAPAFRLGMTGLFNLAQGLDPAARNSTLVTATDVLDVLPRRLLDYLTIDFAQREFPVAYALLHTIGIIELREVEQENDEHRVSFTERTVHWDRVSRAVSDPIGLMKEQYGWDATTGFDTVSLFENLQELGLSLGLRTDFRAVDERARVAFDLALAGNGSVPSPETTKVLGVPLLPIPEATIGAEVYPVAGAGDLVDGFGIGVYADSQLAPTLALTDWLSAEIHLEAFATGFGVVMRKGQDAKLLSALFDATPATVLDNLSLDARVAFVYASPDGLPIVLLGNAEATRLEVASIKVVGGLSKPPAGALDVYSEVALPKLTLAVKAEEGDGFLQDVLGDGFAAALDLTVGFSTRRGLYISGADGLEYSTSLALQAGPIFIDRITLKLRSQGDESIVTTSVNGGLTLGPLTAVIEDIGLELRIDPSRPGILGNADLALGFKPPSGVGLSVDVQGVLSGGGFLFHDEAQGLYAGAMQLSLHEAITLKAFGLIATRMPDGSRGYSLIVFITAEDFRPIPLGLGFMLLGIGGMVGIHRTFDQEVLRQGLTNGTLATLLFPRDPIGNAPTLIRNLASAFPARRGSYLLGLLAKIGWFTPTLVLLDLALILEFGNRTRLLALGRISALLPSADNDLVRLNMEALGVIDFDAGTAAIDAVLVDSRLAHKFPITGSAALRAGFAGGPSFVLSAGGLNPHFAPPTGLPALQRVAIALSSGDNPRLICEAYFAMTSNTVQFGANASLYASAAGFSVTGDVGFDVLVQLIPLHFIADFHARLQLKRGSHNLFMVAVAGELEGPRPLRVSGKASFSILWCDFSVDFDTTLVHGEPPPLPPAIDVLAQLTQALVSPASWSTQRAAAQPHGVALKSLPPPSATSPIVLDPLGQLLVKQQVAPLNTARDIDVFGGAPVAGARRFTLTAALNGTPLASAPLQSAFAPAQFFTMSDDEKLAAPSFEKMDAGCVFGTAPTVIDPTQIIAAPLEYRTITLGAPASTPSTMGSRIAAATASLTPPGYTLSADQLTDFSRSGAAGRAPLRKVGRARFRNDAVQPAATLSPKRWTIMPNADGPAAPLDPSVRTWSEYQAALKTLNRGGARWQILPAYEIES